MQLKIENADLTSDRNFRVLGLDGNNEVKVMNLSEVGSGSTQATWCDLIIYPNQAANKARYRVSDQIAEIEIINLVVSEINPTLRLLNVPAVARPFGLESGFYCTGYGVYSNTPIMFNIDEAGDIYLLANTTSTQNEPFNLTVQYKIFI